MIQPPVARPALRALRHEPWLVDDAAVAQRLELAAVPAESARLARAWLVCWQAALVGDERYGRLDPWSIDLPLGDLVMPRGAGDAERRAELLRLLCDAGLARALTADGRQMYPASSPAKDEAIGVVRVGGSTTDRATLDRAAFTQHRAAVSVDWRAVVAASDREPAALLTARAFAELIVPLDAFAAVPRRDLIERTGYQQKQVRVALRRLVGAGFVDAESESGSTARYRFTARALGRSWVDAAPAASAVGASDAAPRAPQASSTVAGAAAGPAREAPTGQGPAGVATVVSAPPNGGPSTGAAPTGISVSIGGVTLTVDAGAALTVGPEFSVTLGMGDDGRPRLVITPRADA